jgi:TonB family protein
MADSAIGIDRSTDTAPYSPFVSGDRSGADRGARSTVHSTDAPALQDELASLIQLGTEKADAGADGEATECFRKALEIGERILRQDNPDLILLLNDLTRLYLKQSRYADAEPLLLRLFEMKRSKGDEHPEVATVLASLAAVRQALGQHESAEQLWRRVLDIRERTLAPNHFAIATALEHLGDACAARGNIGEALPALQRALTIRERTLGASHPSLRTSKERIADLQLQSAEDPFDVTVGRDALPSPEKYRLLSGEHLRLTPAAPAGVALVRESGPAAPPPPPRDFAAQVASRQTKVILQLPSSESMLPDVVPASEGFSDAQASGADAVPYRDALETIRSELEESQSTVPLTVRLSAWVQRATAFLARREVVAGVIVVVVSVFSVAVAKTRASTDFQSNTGSASSFAPAEASAQTVHALTASALPTPVHETPAETPAANAASKSAAKSHVDDRASRKSDESKPDSRKLTLPTLSKAVMSNLDSVASRAAASNGDRSDPVITMPASGLGTHRASFESADQSSGPTRALLIGELPTPKIPDQAADVEGEVRVRFSVDARGEPVMSTFSVISSPNPLLTAAVRKVIPQMKFVPARTGGSDPKPIADVVETGFRFARQNR